MYFEEAQSAFPDAIARPENQNNLNKVPSE